MVACAGDLANFGRSAHGFGSSESASRGCQESWAKLDKVRAGVLGCHFALFASNWAFGLAENKLQVGSRSAEAGSSYWHSG